MITSSIPTDMDMANWWALLSPQGKIQAEGLIGWDGDGYILDIAKENKPPFLSKMNMFKLRAEVKITDLGETHRVGWSEQSIPGEGWIEHLDSRNKHFSDHEKNLGFRIIAAKENTKKWMKGSDEFTIRRINLGISQLGEDFMPDTLFPHDIGMDLLDGIDFAKGCYVGQEVVSRMRHRGNIRKRPLIVSMDETEGKAIDLDEEILLNGKKIGNVGRVIKGKAVAIVRLDRLSANANNAAYAKIAGHNVTLATPAWASYDFMPDSKK